MSQLDQLPPDQRAVLSLLLRQGRGYDAVAGLLRIDGDAVRARARAALAALAPRETAALDEEDRALIGDYLLGQQPASRRVATRELLEGSAAARTWARRVADQLRATAAHPLPDIPDEAPARRVNRAHVAASPQPSPPASSAAPAVPAAPAGPSGPAAPAAPGAVSEAPLARAEVSTASQSGTARAGRRPAAAAPAAPRLGRPARRPRIGGLVLVLGLGVVVAALIILILDGVIFGGSGSSGSDSSAGLVSSTGTSATPTTTTPSAGSSTTTSSTASARTVAQINFTPPGGGGRGAAVAEVIQQGAQRAFALQAQGLAPTVHFAYAVWLYNSTTDAAPLGFIAQTVSADGKASAVGRLPPNAAHFHSVVITRETASRPAHPGPIVLQGSLRL